MLTLFLNSVVILTAPILLAALGEMVLEKSGILNIGIEGAMLMGAFLGYIVSLFSGNVYVGLVGAALGGLLITMIHGFISISLRGDQVVSGITLNILAFGLTTFGLKSIFGLREVPTYAPSLTEIEIPLLANVPIIGPALFKQNALVYLIYIIVPLLWFIMTKTTIGLRIKSVGEDPKTADTVGINVMLTRYGCIIVSGILAGLAGSMLSLAFLNYFTPGMTAGRGFIALAAVIFGKWSPVGVTLAALLFGGVDALQIRLQLMKLGFPYPFMVMLPYLVTIIALASLKALNPPKSLAVPYKRE